MGEISLEVARALRRKHAIAFPEVLGAVNGPGKVHGQLKLLVAGSNTSWGHCNAHMTQPERHACMAPCMAGHVTAKTSLLLTGASNRSDASSLRSLAYSRIRKIVRPQCNDGFAGQRLSQTK